MLEYNFDSLPSLSRLHSHSYLLHNGCLCPLSLWSGLTILFDITQLIQDFPALSACLWCLWSCHGQSLLIIDTPPQQLPLHKCLFWVSYLECPPVGHSLSVYLVFSYSASIIPWNFLDCLLTCLHFLPSWERWFSEVRDSACFVKLHILNPITLWKPNYNLLNEQMAEKIVGVSTKVFMYLSNDKEVNSLMRTRGVEECLFFKHLCLLFDSHQSSPLVTR